MTFDEFVAEHVRLEGFDSLNDPDICWAHALEFVRRNPGMIATCDELLAAVRDDLDVFSRRPNHAAVRSAALQLWSLYLGAKIAAQAESVARRPRRTTFGLP